MSTMMAATIPDPDRSEAPAPAKTKAAKGSRSYSVTLDGVGGAQLRLVAQRKTDGSAITYVVQVTKTGTKKTSTRGMTTRTATSTPRAGRGREDGHRGSKPQARLDSQGAQGRLHAEARRLHLAPVSDRDSECRAHHDDGR